MTPFDFSYVNFVGELIDQYILHCKINRRVAAWATNNSDPIGQNLDYSRKIWLDTEHQQY